MLILSARPVESVSIEPALSEQAVAFNSIWV
jgi:hypothetical protein